jgi:hypothetical protein
VYADVDGALQVLHELDLLGPVLDGELAPGAAPASGRRGDGDRDCAVPREPHGFARHMTRRAAGARQDDHAWARTGA